jgi:drug/metabolite transporter (DMT)-like permease
MDGLVASSVFSAVFNGIGLAVIAAQDKLLVLSWREKPRDAKLVGLLASLIGVILAGYGDAVETCDPGPS